jgi:hypothetical protein
MANSTRQNWFDETTETLLIDGYVQKLGSFIEAVADGRIDQKELTDQERRLVDLMKKVEPKLDEGLHADVTRLLCELTAYNVMQALASLSDARPKSKLRL